MLGSHKVKHILGNSNNGLKSSDIEPKGPIVFPISHIY